LNVWTCSAYVMAILLSKPVKASRVSDADRKTEPAHESRSCLPHIGYKMQQYTQGKRVRARLWHCSMSQGAAAAPHAIVQGVERWEARSRAPRAVCFSTHHSDAITDQAIAWRAPSALLHRAAGPWCWRLCWASPCSHPRQQHGPRAVPPFTVRTALAAVRAGRALRLAQRCVPAWARSPLPS
jgi:hypothetical protein